MISGSLSDGSSILHAVDPRARLGVCALFIALTAFASSPLVLTALLLCSLLLLALAKISPRRILGRLLLLNLFVALLWGTMPGRDGFFALWGGLPDGALLKLLAMALRCNAMLLAASSLAGTIETSAFGHALAHFGVPDKLSHLFLMTVSQTETLVREQSRLKDAMRVRAFRPATDIHTYRSYANLVAMLLVRSLERAVRLSEAMRCRNFQGRFHLLYHFKMRGGDWAFLAVSFAVLSAFAVLELSCRIY